MHDQNGEKQEPVAQSVLNAGTGELDQRRSGGTDVDRTPRRGPAAPPWRVLGEPAFRSLWAAHLLTLLGEACSLVAMPWLVLQLTGSAVALGTVLALQAVPRAALMLVGGAVADRLSPRLSMLGSAAVRAVPTGMLALLILAHAVQVWQVYGLALLTGVAYAFFLPARFSVLPGVVSDQHLEAGNALLNLNQEGSQFVGPALAGLLVAAVGPGTAFALDAVAFGLAAVLLLGVPSRPRSGRASGGALLGEIGDGLRYAWADPGIRAVLLLTAAVNFATAGSIQVGFPVLAHERFAQGAAAFGGLLAAFGAGSALGVIGAGLRRVPDRFGVLALVAVTWIGLGLGALGLAPALPAAMAAGALTGLAVGVVNTYALTWLMRRTEEAIRGRVMALVMLASLGLAPVSLALAGFVAGHPGTLFGAATAIILAAAVAGSLSRTVRQL